MGKKDELIEALKEVASITQISEMLEISRPTLYKYVEAYCNEDWAGVPQLIKDICDLLAEGSEGSTAKARNELRGYVDTQNLYKKTRLEMERRLADNTERMMNDSNTLSSGDLDETTRARIESDLRRLDESRLAIQKKLASLETDHETSQARMKPGCDGGKPGTQSRFKALKWNTAEVFSVAVQNQDKPSEYCIIFKSRKGLNTYVELAVAVDQNMAVIGRYVPDEGVDCVTVNLPRYGVLVYYQVVQCKGKEPALKSGYMPLR